MSKRGRPVKYKNDAERKAHRNEAKTAMYADLRDQAFLILGNECSRCGVIDRRCLQIDHIHGGGTLHNRTTGSETICRTIIKDPENAKKNFQVLCANCNRIKALANEENKKKYLFKSSSSEAEKGLSVGDEG